MQRLSFQLSRGCNAGNLEALPTEFARRSPIRPEKYRATRCTCWHLAFENGVHILITWRAIHGFPAVEESRKRGPSSAAVGS
jgi:hypothetical protein